MRRVRITDFYKKSSLETVLCWSFFAVSAFLLFLSMGITMYYGIAKERRDVDAAISVLILPPLPWEDNELLTVLSVLLLLTGIIVRLILVWQLFTLRKSFRPEAPEA